MNDKNLVEGHLINKAHGYKVPGTLINSTVEFPGLDFQLAGTRSHNLFDTNEWTFEASD